MLDDVMIGSRPQSYWVFETIKYKNYNIKKLYEEYPHDFE
jgi:hypothetical protein